MSTVVDHPEVAHLQSQHTTNASPETDHGRVEKTRKEEAREIFRKAVATEKPRHNWTKKEIAAIYYQPLMELAFQAVCCFLKLSMDIRQHLHD